VGPPGERPPGVPAAPKSLSPVARIAAVVADLMLASRVSTALEASGHEVEQSSFLPDELDGVDLLVADLDAVSPQELSETGLPVVGFYQHTDSETRAAAEGAGLEVAVPRSRMVRELPELVDSLLTSNGR
jgi:hypothetical protein